MKAAVTNDPDLIAHCGLYCGACRSFLKGRCSGCHENTKATWCMVRACCGEHSYSSCADCTELTDPNQCAKFNNFFSKAIGLVLNSNRQACVNMIREVGYEGFAEFMAANRQQTLPRRGAKRT